MEFANDLLADLRGKVQGPHRGAETPGFDWSGLHGRLVAAHATRAELGRGESPLPVAAGSFAAWRTSAISTGKFLPDVNPNDSADGKAPAGNEYDIAGESGAGDRGPE